MEGIHLSARVAHMNSVHDVDIDLRETHVNHQC